jgi:hypothetical protein
MYMELWIDIARKIVATGGGIVFVGKKAVASLRGTEVIH